MTYSKTMKTLFKKIDETSNLSEDIEKIRGILDNLENAYKIIDIDYLSPQGKFGPTPKHQLSYHLTSEESKILATLIIDGGKKFNQNCLEVKVSHCNAEGAKDAVSKVKNALIQCFTNYEGTQIIALD